MVFYFTSDCVDPPSLIYMGKDKYENEDLIKFGWEQDVWFHVDKLSSAHVYLRLQEGQSWDSIDPKLLEDCAQLTKANSIEGSKLNNLSIIYTPWSNLKKTGEMDVGQVSFKSDKLVKRIPVASKNKEILNRLNKTKEEKYPDLGKEKLQKEKAQRLTQKEYDRKVKKEEEARIERKREKEALRSYSGVFEPEKMNTNKRRNIEEDFM